MRFLLVLACTALPAQAACPVAADLAKGIRFATEDGATETFTSDTPGLVASLYDYEGVQTWTLLQHGIYLVEVSEAENGQPVPATKITFSFSDPVGGLPNPVDGGGWSGVVTTLDGDKTSTETLSYSFGPTVTQVFGDCSYDTVPIEVSYPDRDPPFHEDLIFIPDLGLSVLSGVYEDGGSDEQYVYTSIESVK